MVKIPIRFKRVAEAFDHMAQDGMSRLCDSSGSEHSAADDESFIDLSDLVNSFLERGNEEVFRVDEEEKSDADDDDEEGGTQSKGLLGYGVVQEDLSSLLTMENDDVRMKIHAEVEKAWVQLGGFEFSPSTSKRKLMALLRSRGLDAGLCKSKWEKKGRCPPGVYEYIDVIVEGTRYIVEVSLASEFAIARQTGHYTSLLQLFPTIFVGEVKMLKKIVRVMCNSMRMSMKKEDIHVPPWRRLAYMQAKWHGPYRRTTNEVSKASSDGDRDLAATRSVGFMAALPAKSGYCREDFASRNVVRKVGYLAAAFADSSLLL